MFVDAAQASDEVIFERANRTFSGVAPMVDGGNELVVDVLFDHVCLESGGAFIV